MVGNEPSLTATAEAKDGSTTALLPFIASISRLLTEGGSLDTLLAQSVAGLVGALQGAAYASIYLKQEGSERVTLVAHCHQRAVDEGTRKPRTELAAQVVEYVKPITLMVRYAPDAPFSPVLGLPLSVAGYVLGALVVETDACIADEGDIALLNLVAANLALALENHRLRQRMIALSDLPAAHEQFAI